MSSQPQKSVTHQCRWLLKEQIADYCAQGKCFECGDTGHLSKGCPKCMHAHPPTNLHSTSASVHPEDGTTHFDSLHAVTTMGLLSISLDTSLDSYNLYTTINDVLIAYTLHELYDAMLSAQDFSVETTHDPMSSSCFHMKLIENNEFEISDTFTQDTYQVHQDQPLDTDFNLLAWIFLQKAEGEGAALPCPIPTVCAVRPRTHAGHSLPTALEQNAGH